MLARWLLVIATALYGQVAPVPDLAPICLGPNLLVNGDVELAPGEADWVKRTPDDEKRKLAWSREGGHSGEGCLKITLLEGERSRWRQGQDRRIGVEPECDLWLEGYVRAELEAGGRAYFTVFCMDDSGKVVLQTRTRWVRDHSDWAYRSLWIPVPHGASYVMVYCEAQGALGEAWFDDVSLRLVQPEPKPQPPWVAPILLVTDPAFPTPVPVAVRRLAPQAVTKVRLGEGGALQAIAAARRVCLAPLGRERDAEPVAESVQRALEGGGTVVCHLDVAASLLGAGLVQQPLAGLPTMDIPLPASKESRQVVLRVRDDTRGDSAWYLLGPDGERLFGEVREDPETKPAERGRLVVFPSLSPGADGLARLGVCPGGRDPCLVKSVEVRCGDRTLHSSSPGALERTSFEEAKEPKGSVQVDRGAVERARIVITAETNATRGFTKGDKVPWYGGIARCGLVDLDDSRARPLALRDDGAVVALEMAWPGGGRLVAYDLLAAEPLHRLEGGLSKYVLLSNVLGRGVAYGRFFPEKPSYDEIAAHLQELARASIVPVEFVEEGPDCQGRQIVSLTFGDASRPLLLLVAAEHGNEFEPVLGLVRLCELLTAGELAGALDLRRYCLKIIPVLGPSGYDAMTRCQASKVNLNRQGDWYHDSYTAKDTNKDGRYGCGDSDWKGEAPWSEPEAQVVKRIVQEHEIHGVLEFHTNASFASMPVTARPENELRVGLGFRLFREMFRGRHAWARGDGQRPGTHYRIWHQAFGESAPMLIHTTARDSLGALLELPGYSGGPYASLVVSDLTVCAVLAHLKAFTGEAPVGRGLSDEG